MEDDLDLSWLEDAMENSGLSITGSDTSDLDSLLDWAVSSGNASFLSDIGKFLKSNDTKAVAGIAGALIPFLGGGGSGTRPTGYQGKIPTYTMQRSLQEGVFAPSDRRPGSMGRRYFTDYSFVPTTPAPAPAPAPADTGSTAGSERDPNDEGMAAGGIAALKKGRYLRGPTDGMEDKLRTSIENKQPAALSHGEFVVPADVVSHLGNGNSEAGAKKLYEMMDRIRKARTGTKEQGRQINPNKFLPR